MKTTFELETIRDLLIKEYRPAFEAVGNNLAVGIGKDSIEVRLANEKLKSSLPETYHGAKVNVIVVGVVRGL